MWRSRSDPPKSARGITFEVPVARRQPGNATAAGDYSQWENVEELIATRTILLEFDPMPDTYASAFVEAIQEIAEDAGGLRAPSGLGNILGIYPMPGDRAKVR